MRSLRKGNKEGRTHSYEEKEMMDPYICNRCKKAITDPSNDLVMIVEPMYMGDKVIEHICKKCNEKEKEEKK
jgi:hypothetical protein